MTRNDRSARWAGVGRWAMAAFALVVVVLLVRYARTVDWREVAATVAAYDAGPLAVAGALALLSHALYATYDLAARTYVRHRLATARVLLVAFVSYAFNLNLGALVGGAGFRVRLYSRSGLRLADIGRVIAFSVATNWLGYVALAGVLFVAGIIAPPEDWPIGRAGLRVLGAAMLATVVGYLAACALGHGRAVIVRGHALHLPSLPMGALQLALSTANWLTIAAIIFVLLHRQVPYPDVLGVLLLGAVAAAMIHVPAGLGVLEAVFVALLGSRVAEPKLLAALLTYRAIYYLAPLIVAVVVYLAFEVKAGRGRGVAGMHARPNA